MWVCINVIITLNIDFYYTLICHIPQVVHLPKETYATDIHWLPPTGSKKQTNQADLFVLACTDGKFLLVSRLGRVEKSVEAHKGAVLGAQWSNDGSAMLTCKLSASLRCRTFNERALVLSAKVAECTNV